MQLPRGIRNNNPGNLVKSDVKWQGLSKEQIDPKFCTFDDAVYGIRAIGRQLISYQDNHGCKSVTDAIKLYAPPSDSNPTDAYAFNVAKAIGCGTGTEVNWHDYKFLRPALEAIITQENGGPWQNWYTDAQLTKACVLAGVEPARRSLLANKQVIGSVIAGTATAAQPVVQTVQAQLQPLTDYSDHLKHIFVLVALAGVVLTVLAKIDERRKGIS